MICESCGKNEATIHFTKIEQGEMEEKHLCENCAKKEDEINFGWNFSYNDLFSGLLGFSVEGDTKATKSDLVCDKCGLSYRRLLGTGKFGCPSCFKNFRDEVEPLLKSIHGHDEHVGKIPSNTSERVKQKKLIRSLRDDLNIAVEEERFEDAASLRDEIRSIEEKAGHGSSRHSKESDGEE